MRNNSSLYFIIYFYLAVLANNILLSSFLSFDTLCLVVLQKVMQLPTISGSIEVWDFLSVDSQVLYFLPL